jgi:hypothetical protein
MSLVLSRYVCTAACARLADEGARVAVLLLAVERTGGAGLGGLLVAALMVPHVLAAPVVGAFADAARRRRALYVAVFLAYAALLAGAAPLIGSCPVAAAGLLLAAGCCAPLLIGGLTSLLGELAGDRLERAFGLDVTTYAVAGIAGPAVAAVIAATVGGIWSMLALAGLAGMAAVLVGTLPLRVGSGRRWRWAESLGALSVIVRDRELSAVTAGSVLKEIGLGALPVVAALLASRVHDTAYTGLVLSMTAAGGLAGSLITTAFPVRRSPLTVTRACLAGTTAVFVLLTAAPDGWLALTLLAVAGALGSLLVVAVFAARDRAAPPRARTQVFTLGAGLKVTGAALGAAMAGLAAPAGPVLLLIGIAGCQMLGLIVTVVVARITFRARKPASIVS